MDSAITLLPLPWQRLQIRETIFLVLGAGTFLLLFRLFRLQSSLKFPVVKVNKTLGDRDVISALERGSKLYPEQPFTFMDGPLTVVILPVSWLSDLKDIPLKTASFRNFLYSYWFGRYSYIGQYSHELESAIRVGMGKDVDKQLRTLMDETHFAVDQHIGECQSWKEVRLSSTFHAIIALTTFRMFVGLPLSRNQTWLHATTQYASTLEKFSTAVRAWPEALRWLAAPLIWFNSVRKHQQVFINMLDPIVRSTKQVRRAQSEGVADKNANTLIEWMLSYYRGREATASEITGAQLTASFAAIHSTDVLVEHVLMDLAARPAALSILREELNEVCPDGELNKTSVSKLWKMDSFIRESQRFNPATAFHMLRMASKNVKLGKWDTIPPGTMFAISSAATNKNTIYDRPEVFDGFRFARIRAEPGNESRYQLVSTGTDATSFGHGPNACPGRNFAANEIKVLLAHLIQRYDIKLMDGESRPENLVFPGGAIFPDPKACIVVKNRCTAEM